MPGDQAVGRAVRRLPSRRRSARPPALRSPPAVAAGRCSPPGWRWRSARRHRRRSTRGPAAERDPGAVVADRREHGARRAARLAAGPGDPAAACRCRGPRRVRSAAPWASGRRRSCSARWSGLAVGRLATSGGDGRTAPRSRRRRCSPTGRSRRLVFRDAQVSLLAERVPAEDLPFVVPLRGAHAVRRHRLRPGPGRRAGRPLRRPTRRTPGIVASLDELAGPELRPGAGRPAGAGVLRAHHPVHASTSSRSGGSWVRPGYLLYRTLVARPLGQASVPMNQREALRGVRSRIDTITAARRHELTTSAAGSARSPTTTSRSTSASTPPTGTAAAATSASGSRCRRRSFTATLLPRPRPGGGLVLTSRSDADAPRPLPDLHRPRDRATSPRWPCHGSASSSTSTSRTASCGPSTRSGSSGSRSWCCTTGSRASRRPPRDRARLIVGVSRGACGDPGSGRLEVAAPPAEPLDPPRCAGVRVGGDTRGVRGALRRALERDLERPRREAADERPRPPRRSAVARRRPGSRRTPASPLGTGPPGADRPCVANALRTRAAPAVPATATRAPPAAPGARRAPCRGSATTDRARSR